MSISEDCKTGMNEMGQVSPYQTEASGVHVRRKESGQFGLFASRGFRSGEVVLQLAGTLTNLPTRWSIQIGSRLHLDACVGDSEAAGRHPYPWRFLNHSCAPTVRIAAPEVIAIDDIAEGDELTFDYNTTELEIAEPFFCECQRPTCRQQKIRGFMHLSHPERKRIAHLLSPHIVQIYDE